MRTKSSGELKTDFPIYGELNYDAEERERWIAGELQEKWFNEYPQLFDDDDLRITRNQRRKHYFEWKSAIHLYEAEGWHTLVEKYRNKNHNKNHKMKQETLRRLLPDRPDIIDFMRNAKPQCPDILAYKADYSNFSFVEVKGGKDRLQKEQVEHFKNLHRLTGKQISLLLFKATPC